MLKCDGNVIIVVKTLGSHITRPFTYGHTVTSWPQGARQEPVNYCVSVDQVKSSQVGKK